MRRVEGGLGGAGGLCVVESVRTDEKLSDGKLEGSQR